MTNERSWTDTQLTVGFLCLNLVQTTPFFRGPHPFTTLTSFIVAINQLAEVADIPGSARVFQEALCLRMGYDYAKITAGLDEMQCRVESVNELESS